VEPLEEIQLSMQMVLLLPMLPVPLRVLMQETIATGTLSLMLIVDIAHFTQVLASPEQLVLLEPVILIRRSKCATGLLLSKSMTKVTVSMLLTYQVQWRLQLLKLKGNSKP
jgi:hypothetical protein